MFSYTFLKAALARSMPRQWQLAFAAAVLTALLGPGTAQAAEWTLAPEIEAGTHYDDNAGLDEDDEGDVVIWGGFVDLGALAQRRTERSTFLVRPRARFTEYPGDDDQSSDDQYLDARASTKGLRSQWNVVANYSRVQVIRGEDVNVQFPDPEIEDPEVGETGRVAVKRRRSLLRIGPSFSYELTERMDAGVALNYLDVSYDKELSGEALDYTDMRAELFLARELAEDSRLRATLFVSEYEVDEISNQSTSYGFRAGYERDISETFNVFFNVGLQDTDIEVESGNQVDDSASSVLLDAGFNRNWERTRLRVLLGRQVQPTGTGFLRETDLLQVNVRHQFRPRWYGHFGGIVQQSNSVDDAVEVNDRDYYRVRAGVEYELTREWTLEAELGRTFQDYENEPGDADANEAFLKVRYAPRGRVWSR